MNKRNDSFPAWRVIIWTRRRMIRRAMPDENVVHLFARTCRSRMIPHISHTRSWRCRQSFGEARRRARTIRPFRGGRCESGSGSTPL